MKKKKFHIDSKALAENPTPLFKFYGIGGLLFFIGFSSILGAEHKLTPSIEQELAALGGVILTGIGFVIVMVAQLIFIWVRLVKNQKTFNYRDQVLYGYTHQTELLYH